MVRRFHQACKDYGLLEEGDHILVGLSGGKDSLALVQLLGEQQRIYVPRIQVMAVHVSVTNIGYRVDMDYLRDFCAQHGVEFRHETVAFDESTDRRKTHCFLCSWNRRKVLFETAQRLGCNKLALGHHKDDFVETFLLNLCFQGEADSMRPKMQMRKFPLTLIRPLCLLEERDMQHFAEVNGYRKQLRPCPYEQESHRADMKGIIAQLEAMNPHVRDCLFGAMEKLFATAREATRCCSD